MNGNPCTIDGPRPFDRLTFTRVRDELRQPTEWIEIVGEKDGGERTVRVLYNSLWEQMETHMRFHHGTTLADPYGYEEIRTTVKRRGTTAANGVRCPRTSADSYSHSSSTG